MHYLRTYAGQDGKVVHGRQVADMKRPIIGWSCIGSVHSEGSPDLLGGTHTRGKSANVFQRSAPTEAVQPTDKRQSLEL